MTVPHSGKGWRLAPALVAMEAEADRIAPGRNRASDGSIGDQAHAARKSDHNPRSGYVRALDLTHSPERGWDTHARARQVAINVKNGIEKRINYIISDWLIFSKVNGVWAWRKYTGPNGHTHHAHYSLADGHEGDTSAWFLGVPAFPTTPPPPPYTPPAPAAPQIPEPQEAPMAAEILVVDMDHPRKGQVWEFFGDRTRRLVPQAGNRANLTVAAAQAWGRRPLRIQTVQQRSMMDVLFERYKDATPPADYDADRIPPNKRG